MAGRETDERNAALERGESLRFVDAQPKCAPDLPGLNPDLLYTLSPTTYATMRFS